VAALVALYLMNCLTPASVLQPVKSNFLDNPRSHLLMAHCVEGHVIEYGRFRDQRAYELRLMLEASTPRRQCGSFFLDVGARKLI
jgi:hypothetical protein